MKRMVTVTIMLVLTFLFAADAVCERTIKGIGYAVLSTGGSLFSPNSFIEEYFCHLNGSELSKLRDAIQDGQLKSEPLTSFDDICGVKNQFFRVSSLQEQAGELTDILGKRFIFTEVESQRVYLSVSAIEYLETSLGVAEKQSVLLAISENRDCKPPGEQIYLLGYNVDIESSGNEVLSSSGQFVPVKGSFEVKGAFESFRASRIAPWVLPYTDSISARIGSWSLQKRGNDVIGYIMMLDSGQVVVPTNEVLLWRIAGEDDSKFANVQPDGGTHPDDGPLKMRVIGFNDQGAIVSLDNQMGLYFASRIEDINHPRFVIFADDPAYCTIEADETVRRRAREILKQ